ncbi:MULTISPECIES: signal peptidase I [Thermus]|uniref:Signal peptidase I n=1 Tax=Thermus scotoductus (strain ATCC 700910 / SA-01) TaxID=743525 RepID=E8PNC5_THESS|nr:MULTISPECIES: signal peptidase I [Thermus]ADW22659.1 signal peptidase I [Thermus scotoductus SA-01]
MKAFWEYLFKEWFRQVGEALLVAFLVTTFVFTTVGVVGQSMFPTLQNGDRVLVPKWETWLVRFGLMDWRRGEIAILKPPEGTPNATARFPILGFSFRAFFIKRIVAVPGDEVYVERGVVYVNGKPLDERHITDRIAPWPDSFPGVCYKDGRMTRILTQQGDFPVELLPAYLKPLREMLLPPSQEVLARSRLTEACEVGKIRLKKGYYFVMGDNRTLGGSEDSRTFGPVHMRAIGGRASFVWWPIFVWEEGKIRLNLRRLSPPPAYQVP